MMPFLMMKALAQQREADLRRNPGPVPPKRGRATRQRLGWLLVDLGLRLAATRPAVDPPCCGSLA